MCQILPTWIGSTTCTQTCIYVLFDWVNYISWFTRSGTNVRDVYSHWYKCTWHCLIGQSCRQFNYNRLGVVLLHMFSFLVICIVLVIFLQCFWNWHIHCFSIRSKCSITILCINALWNNKVAQQSINNIQYSVEYYDYITIVWWS